MYLLDFYICALAPACGVGAGALGRGAARRACALPARLLPAAGQHWCALPCHLITFVRSAMTTWNLRTGKLLVGYLPGEASNDDALSGVQPPGQPHHIAAAPDAPCQRPGAAEVWVEQHSAFHHPHAALPAQCNQHGTEEDHSHLHLHEQPPGHHEAPGQDAEAILRSWERLIHGAPAAPEQPQYHLHGAAHGQGAPGDANWGNSGMHASGMPAGGGWTLSAGALCGQAHGATHAAGAAS